MQWGQLKTYVTGALKSYFEQDLRWSQLTIAGLVLAGVVVNLLLPHGWTVWPIVLAAGLLIMINEAAGRAGHGVPPLQVYALFGGVIGAWLIVVLVLSKIPPIFFVLGMIVLGYFCARAFLKNQQHQRLIEQRRSDGQCVHCGEPVVEGQTFCESCGEEANPQGTRSKWSTLSARSPQDQARMRSLLRPESPASAARAKEQALLNRRQRKHSPRR